MPSLLDLDISLDKRYIYYGSSSSNGARWAYFAIVAVAIVLFIASIILVNRRRGRRGVKPIQGTQWMTPPSYYQSQGQYNQPTRNDPNMPSSYVPQYSEQTNAGDMGHYAADGTFYPSQNNNGPTYPQNAYPRNTTNSDGQPVQNFGDSGTRVVADEDYSAPSGPPPSSSNGGNYSAPSDSKSAFDRPNHPPPSAR